MFYVSDTLFYVTNVNARRKNDSSVRREARRLWKYESEYTRFHGYSGAKSNENIFREACLFRELRTSGIDATVDAALDTRQGHFMTKTPFCDRAKQTGFRLQSLRGI